MLIEFRVSNHRSIRAEQVLSMEVGRTTDKADPRAREVAGASTPLLPVTAIYGANASGKSNVLDALGFMVDAVAVSHRLWAPDGGVPRDPFAWGGERDAPSVFECHLVDEGVRFEYGFAANDEAFVEEWLYAWPNGRKQTWFERDLQVFKFGEHFHGESRLIEQTTRPNSLFLSAAAQNRDAQLSKLFAWFRNVRIAGLPEFRGLSSVDRSLQHLLLRERPTSQLSLFDGPEPARDERLQAVIDLLRAADIGIVDMKVEVPLGGEFRAGDRAAARNAEIFLRHRSKTGEAWLPLREESAGTKMLLRLAESLLSTLRTGGVFVVDGLEASLHPLLRLHLVQMFNDRDKNPRNAQLVFTTHDTNLLGTSQGPAALQRDQVWLTEKDDDGATQLYPLTDYKPRKAENLETGYLQGRYGAIPLFHTLSTNAQ